MRNKNLGKFLTKYTMVIALVAVFFLFCGLTGGRLLYAQNMSNLLLQNGYVLVMACGMLLCILTGGNIDLSVGSVNGSTGTSFEMDAIGSCFIGGASAYGGSGTVGGVVIGALLLGIINMGMSILGIGDSWQYIVKGAVLLIAVIFDVVSSRKNGK